jgi:hypothetical protein
MKIVKPRTPKSRNVGLTFLFFHFRNLCMSRFGHRNLWSFESKNPKVQDPPSLFPHFKGLNMWLFGHLHLWNPELQFLEVLITFHIFGSCSVFMIDFCVHENPNPETSKYSASCHNFGKCCVLMSGSCTRKAQNPKTLKCRPTVIPYFIFRQTIGYFILFDTCDDQNLIDLCFFTKL